MNDRDENPVLVAVATTIADGHPVDWESVMKEHPELMEELEGLRVLQGVEEASSRAGKSRGPGGK
ncbi:MAG TPA: hypothetical protein VN539_02340 [Candidatus Saccharimonadales bacterium]|nr:hypothetical protein [Candidatus Saccharimonadales bacterium]